VNVDLIVKQGLQKGSSGSTSPVIGAGKVTDGVVAEDTTFSLSVKSSEHIGHIVWEEALVVHHGRQHLSNSWGGHYSVVRVLVHLKLNSCYFSGQLLKKNY